MAYVSDCRARTAERPVKLLALVAVVGWRIYWLTTSARAHPDDDPSKVLTTSEITIAIQIARRRNFG